MNRVELLGNLTRDPVLRYTAAEESVAVCRFTVAVQRPVKKKGENEADFINCTAFGKTADNISKYFTKGRKIAVFGRVRTGSYVKDDTKVYYTDIAVEGFDFCDSKATENAPTSEAYTLPEDINEEDLPF